MTLITKEPPFDISEPRLRTLYEYWHSKVHDGRLPARADIDPLEMKDWLGNLMLIEFHGDVYNYQIRLDGTNLEHYYGTRRTGHGVESLTDEDERRLLMDQYAAVLEGKCPAYYEADFTNSDGVFARQTKLILPLSADKEHVDMVLVGIYFRPTDEGEIA
ncbi:PAS domain-containing protein [Dongia sp.]|uniref:PAS domain-containing protein n=1 Tax=Dongia sp. TaxID=1977262 RepID=UPI0035B13A5A